MSLMSCIFNRQCCFGAVTRALTHSVPCVTEIQRSCRPARAFYYIKKPTQKYDVCGFLWRVHWPSVGLLKVLAPLYPRRGGPERTTAEPILVKDHHGWRWWSGNSALVANDRTRDQTSQFLNSFSVFYDDFHRNDRNTCCFGGFFFYFRRCCFCEQSEAVRRS